VLADAERGALQARYGAREAAFDLADAPMPRFELLEIEKYNRLTVQTSRGCPHLCEFCASSVLLTSRYKQKPVAKVLAELDRIRELWAAPFIEFADDNSLIHAAYWRELLPEIARRHLHWFTETDLSIARHEDLLRLMRASGCAQVLIGFESPTVSPLDGLEIRRNWKHQRWREYRDAIRTIQSHGISVNGCFVLGLDGQGPEVFDEVFDFVRAAELYEVQITLQTPFPGTPLYDRLAAAGRLLDFDGWRKCTLFDVTFRPQRMTVDALRQGFRDLAVRLYSEELTRERRHKFRAALRAATHPDDAAPR
jgi:radical SAM superfamily enzyme YgiQ (UPF0313 family)